MSKGDSAAVDIHLANIEIELLKAVDIPGKDGWSQYGRGEN
jgi:hypothetical protein